MRASGTFDVKLNPLGAHAGGSDGVNLGHMSIDKTFYGDLEARSRGEMLSAMTATRGSAGYVAIEQVNGALAGRNGSFVLQHFGTMDRGKNRLILEVIPDSASGELEGLSGSMTINIEDGKHYYDFEYELP
jgi:hypothetical protein